MTGKVCYFSHIIQLSSRLPVDEDDDVGYSDEEEDYSIKYEVPYKNAKRELVLPASKPYGAFLTALAGKMEVSIVHLSAIGYIPSWIPKSHKPVPKLLESTQDYESMMQVITEYRADKPGKAFTIALSDTSEPPVDGRNKVGDSCAVRRHSSLLTCT